MPLIPESSVDSVVYVCLAPGFAHCPVSIRLPYRRTHYPPGCFLATEICGCPLLLCLNLELKKKNPFSAVLVEIHGRRNQISV